MDEATKEELTVILDLLKKCIIKNYVAMATDNDGNIYFFDANTYVKTKTMSGFSVNINDMVK